MAKKPSRDKREAREGLRTAWGLSRAYRSPPITIATEEDRAQLTAERDHYTIELGWDGHRIAACRMVEDVKLFAPDLRDWTKELTTLPNAIKRLGPKQLVLDGFACVLDEHGRPSHTLLRQWIAGARTSPLVYVAWDVLFDGEDLRQKPLAERRERLAQILSTAPPAIVPSSALPGNLDEIGASLAKMNLPGYIARGDDMCVAVAVSDAEAMERIAFRTTALLSPPPQVTNATKVLYPRDNITKTDVVEYYSDIAEVMLRYTKDRPIVAQRWPDGIDEFTWYQHRVPPRAPDYVRPVFIEGNRRILIQNRDALVWLANQAALTFHAWASRIDSLTEPDWCVLDLDPGESTTREQLIDVALALRKLLEILELPSVVKTSGQKGMHIMIPLASKQTVAQAHAFARHVAMVLNRLMPNVISLEADKERRAGRLYLDHLQSFMGKSLVLPYSLRAVDCAPVSAPLEWSEVTHKLDPKSFNLRTMRERVEEKGDLFEPLLTGTVDLSKVLAGLNG